MVNPLKHSQDKTVRGSGIENEMASTTPTEAKHLLPERKENTPEEDVNQDWNEFLDL